MRSPKIVFLPGLDGDGFYYDALKSRLQATYDCVTLSYPKEFMDYPALCRWALGQLDDTSDYIVIGESYGGPLGILLAQALGDRAKGLVLSATFCRSPVPGPIVKTVAALYPYVIRTEMGAYLVSFFLCNGQDLKLARKLQGVLAGAGDTIRQRIASLAALDVTREAAALDLPCLRLKPSADTLLWSGHFPPMKHQQTQRIQGPHGLMATRPHDCEIAISGFIKAINSPIFSAPQR